MQVVHCKREPYDIYIGRPSKWGNIFSIGKDGTREEVIKKHKEWLAQQPELLAQLPELEGKILGCWCAPKACHGDTLLEWANVSLEDLKIQIAKINMEHNETAPR